MSCSYEVIAENEIGFVNLCKCGTVTVNCGNAAIKLPKTHFILFARMLDEAFSNLAARELEQSGSGDKPVQN